MYRIAAGCEEWKVLQKMIDEQTLKAYDKIISLLEQLQEEKKNFRNLKIEDPVVKEALDQDVNNHNKLPFDCLLKLAFNDKFTLKEEQIKEICNGPEDEVAARLFGGDAAIDLLKQRFEKQSISELQRFLNEDLPKFISDNKILVLKDKSEIEEGIRAETGTPLYRIKQLAESELNEKIEHKNRKVEAHNQNIRDDYWANNIKPLINKIDIAITPMRISGELYLSYELGHTMALWKAIESNRPEDLDHIIHEFRKLKRIVEVLPPKKQAEAEQKDTPTTIININKLGVLGDIQQVETLQTGDNASAHKQVVGEEKKKGILRRIPYWIYLLVSFLAALLAILHYVGWLAPNK